MPCWIWNSIFDCTDFVFLFRIVLFINLSLFFSVQQKIKLLETGGNKIEQYCINWFMSYKNLFISQYLSLSSSICRTCLILFNACEFLFIVAVSVSLYDFARIFGVLLFPFTLFDFVNVPFEILELPAIPPLNDDCRLGLFSEYLKLNR